MKMRLKVPKQTSQRIRNTPAIVRAQKIPHEIFGETESFGHRNANMNESECFQDFYRQLTKDDVALIDSVIAKVGRDFDHFDIFNYTNPELDASLDDGIEKLMNTIDSGMGILENNLNTSIGTATENNSRKMLAGPVQQLQSEIDQQKTHSQLQEEFNHLKQVNLQLQELNCFKASEMKPQQSLEKMEQQKLPQVEQDSTAVNQIHEIDAQSGIATVNNPLPLSSSDLFRPKKLQRFPNESMQQHVENNEEIIVLQSETIPMIDPGDQEQHRVVKLSNKRPATINLRKTAKQTRRCSQVSVDQEINDGIDYHDGINYHDEEDKEIDSDGRNDVYDNVRLNKSKQDERDKPHLCNVCNKLFRRKGDLSRHLKIHTEKPHLCKVCNMSFRRKDFLSHHLNVHTGEKPYLCKVFGRKEHLSGHISKICGGKNQLTQQLFFCDYCGKGFSNKTHLKSHCFPCYKNRLAGTSRKSSH